MSVRTRVNHEEVLGLNPTNGIRSFVVKHSFKRILLGGQIADSRKIVNGRNCHAQHVFGIVLDLIGVEFCNRVHGTMRSCVHWHSGCQGCCASVRCAARGVIDFTVVLVAHGSDAVAASLSSAVSGVVALLLAEVADHVRASLRTSFRA